MIISFTGSQSGMTNFQKEEFIKILSIKQCTELVHGDCIGSDLQAALLAVDNGVKIFTVYPPDNRKKRAFFADPTQRFLHNRIITPYMDVVVNDRPIKVKWMPVEPYLKRNIKIVDASGLLIATPKEFKHTVRSGTWATIRYAWKNKKDTVIIPSIERSDNV